MHMFIFIFILQPEVLMIFMFTLWLVSLPSMYLHILSWVMFCCILHTFIVELSKRSCYALIDTAHTFTHHKYTATNSCKQTQTWTLSNITSPRKGYSALIGLPRLCKPRQLTMCYLVLFPTIGKNMLGPVTWRFQCSINNLLFPDMIHSKERSIWKNNITLKFWCAITGMFHNWMFASNFHYA